MNLPQDIMKVEIEYDLVIRNDGLEMTDTGTQLIGKDEYYGYMIDYSNFSFEDGQTVELQLHLEIKHIHISCDKGISKLQNELWNDYGFV